MLWRAHASGSKQEGNTSGAGGGKVATLHDFCKVLELQQNLIRELRHDLNRCQDETLVLRESLCESNVLDPIQFSVRLHRHHFASMRAKHGFSTAETLSDLLRSDDIVRLVTMGTGTAGMLAAGCSCKEIGLAVKSSLQSVGSLGSYFYVCGGQEGGVPKDSVERYSVDNDEWEVVPDMARKRRGAMAAIIAQKLFVCGGHDGTEALASMECLCITKNVWSDVLSMPEARWGAAVGVIGSRLYIAGGKNCEGEYLASCLCFDDDDQTRWEVLSPMSEARCQPASGVFDGRLIVCGGCSEEGPLNSVECFLPPSGIWVKLPPMKDLRERGVAATAPNGLYVCGGRMSGMQCFSSAEKLGSSVLDVGSQVLLSPKGASVAGDYDWSYDPLRPGDVGLVQELEEDQVYVVGPRDDRDWYYMDDVECLSWDSVSSMSVGRVDAVAAASGRYVYVFGGWDGRRRLNTVECLDTHSGIWTPAAPMLEHRMLATAAVYEGR